ncbi:RNA-binding protein Musashi homolog Rbp6-like isoform X3 [Acanthaster planci]|uniref:RNA-binding protein Musashi homolog Rbp6-like isoform X3 n=1 Tax=Acanthaster planci TaxID=133434 RepID=A0A8B7ZG80_ACAPL|nr:RNA-binding protein Musashi homolog Rbp6-like isoform X3 [Acanthaster planci]
MDAGNNQNSTVHGTEVANDPGKMFIGGLSWQTETDSLREYFRKYGEIKECVIMRDPNSKKSRGFGFVTFGDPKCVEKVLKTERHEVDSKKIDPKVAFPKRSPPKIDDNSEPCNGTPVTRTKKIFVGGLAASTTPEDLKNYFQQFGKVEDVTLMMDRQTNRHRGFGFVVMETEDDVNKICEMHYHEVKDKMVETKKAQPKEVMMPQNQLRQRTALMRNMYGMYVVDPVTPWTPYAQGTCANASLSSPMPILLESVPNVKGYPANFAFGRSIPAYPPFTPYFSENTNEQLTYLKTTGLDKSVCIASPGLHAYPGGYAVMPHGLQPAVDQRRTGGYIPYSYPDYGSAGPAAPAATLRAANAHNRTDGGTAVTQHQQADYNREYHQAAVMNSPYAQQSYAPSPSPVNSRSGFNVNSSPGPMDLYAVSTTQAEQNAMTSNFVPAVSPQPNSYGMGQKALIAPNFPNVNGYTMQ